MNILVPKKYLIESSGTKFIYDKYKEFKKDKKNVDFVQLKKWLNKEMRAMNLVYYWG